MYENSEILGRSGLITLNGMSAAIERCNKSPLLVSNKFPTKQAAFTVPTH